jgi:hypothetical protein
MGQRGKLGALAAALLASIRAASVPDFGAELSGLLNPLLSTGEQAAGASAGVPLVGPPMGPTTGSWLGGPSNGGADGQWLKEATQRSEEAQKEEEELIAAYQQQYMAAMQQQYAAALEAQEAHAQTGGGPWIGTPFLNGQAANVLDPAAPMPGVLELDQYTATKLIGGPTPVVVQFYMHAGMCPNCAVMSSTMRALGSHYATEHNIMIAKVNAMDAGQLSAEFGIDQMALPAVLHFKAGSTTPNIYSGSGSTDALLDYIEQHEDVVKEGQVPELRGMVSRFLLSKNKSERDELRKQTSAQVNELRSEMVLYGESYVSVMERILAPSKTERWLKNQRAKLLATRADASAPEAKQQKARRQLNVLADFEVGLAESKKVEETAESIRIAVEEAEAYAKRSKAKAAVDRENKSVAEREW